MNSLKHIMAVIIPRTLVLYVKYVLQYIDRKRRGKKLINTNKNVKCLSKQNTHVFFGYYDISPFNTQRDEIVYLNLNEKENFVHIMLNTCDNSNEVELATSRAWNWQQGCRLRWMPNNDREVVFNDFDGWSYYSRIFNVDNKEEKRIDSPLYDISPDGRYGLSIDFERLGVKRPGYGYTCREYKEDKHDLNNECIYLIDIANNKKEVLLTYSDIIKIKGCESKNLKDNYINHLCFSPTGRKFLFFWLTADTNWHKAYLLVHDLDTKETKLLENSEKVSHYVWQDDDNIICTSADDKQNWHYYIYNITSATKTLMNPQILNNDGHPSLFAEGKIVTDTYPNRNGYQYLFIANKDIGGYELLVEIYSNCKIEGEKRTDLHPRYDNQRGLICFDSNQKRYRTLMLLSV